MRINLALSFLGLATNVCLFFSLPERVPVHFDLSGNPDRWGSRWEVLATGLGALIILLLIYYFVPRIDPKRKPLWSSKGYHLLFSALFLLPVFLPLLPYFYLHKIPVNTLVVALLSLVFIIMGNYLPTIKPNYFVGIRTPWTLEDERVWKKTHRAGGWGFVGAGIFSLLLVLFTPPKIAIMGSLLALLLVSLSLVIYSYILWKRGG